MISRMKAFGLNPFLSAYSSVDSRAADAPSERKEAFPEAGDEQS
jgi:hypothetical protein